MKLPEYGPSRRPAGVFKARSLSSRRESSGPAFRVHVAAKSTSPGYTAVPSEDHVCPGHPKQDPNTVSVLCPTPRRWIRGYVPSPSSYRGHVAPIQTAYHTASVAVPADRRVQPRTAPTSVSNKELLVSHQPFLPRPSQVSGSGRSFRRPTAGIQPQNDQRVQQRTAGSSPAFSNTFPKSLVAVARFAVPRAVPDRRLISVSNREPLVPHQLFLLQATFSSQATSARLVLPRPVPRRRTFIVSNQEPLVRPSLFLRHTSTKSQVAIACSSIPRPVPRRRTIVVTTREPLVPHST